MPQDPLLVTINEIFKKSSNKKHTDCHRSSHILTEAFEIMGKSKENVLMIDDNRMRQYMKKTDSKYIIEIIRNYLKTPSNGNFIMNLNFRHHTFFIEILNQTWRILSQYDTYHNFLEYAESGKYGKFNSLEMLSSLEIDLNKLYETPQTINELLEINEMVKDVFLDVNVLKSYGDITHYTDDEVRSRYIYIGNLKLSRVDKWISGVK